MRKLLVAVVVVGALLAPAATPVPAAAATPLRVGVVDSTTTYINLAQQGWYEGRPPGTVAFLQASGYDVVVLDDADLANRATLDGLDVLFLPMTRVIDEAAANTITSWVADGGGLVAAFIGPRMFPRAGCRWTGPAHPRVTPDWQAYWSCQGSSDGGFSFWFREMNSNVWEWGPMSVMYGTRLVNDPTPRSFAVLDEGTHPIVANTMANLGISSIRFDRGDGAGAEFVSRFNSLTTSLLRFSIAPGTGSVEGVNVDGFDGYTAAQAGRYGKGRFVYFDFNVLDFLPQVNGGLAAQVHEGRTEGEIAAELLRQTVDWVAAPSVEAPPAPVARTWGEVDVWQGAIYVAQFVEAVGTHAVHGVGHVRILDPSGRVVFRTETVPVGLYPGQGPLRYSSSYLTSKLQDGTYTVEVDFVFTYPAYDEIHLERAEVVRGQGTGIRTQVGTASALPPRLSGADRFATAAAVSADRFAPGVPVVYVATGNGFPDALAGVPAAIHDGGPILLTRAGSLPAATRQDLARLSPGRIVVLGGTGAVSDAVAAELAGYTDGPVTRIAGADRYATAAAVSQATFPDGAAIVYLATGENYPDALAGGPVAGLAGGPILLTTPDRVPGATRREILRLRPQEVVILGGEGAVSAAVADTVAGWVPQVSRIAGSDRYATAVQVSRSRFGAGVPVVYVATATDFPDALAGGVAAGLGGGPVLLVNAAGVPPSTAGELRRLQPGRIVILGGEGAVSTAVAAQLAGYVAP